jgi:hypothetical protein
MPTTRRRRLHAVRVPLSEACRHYLRTGEHVPRGVFGTWADAFGLSGRLMRLVAQGGAPLVEWAEWGAELIAEHIAEQPGTRPHGWWAFSAPAPRECPGAEHAPSPLALWRLHKGIAIEWHRLEPGVVLSLESEAHFLRRHGLLKPGERQRIPLAAFEPEAIEIRDDEDKKPDDIRFDLRHTEAHPDEEEELPL